MFGGRDSGKPRMETVVDERQEFVTNSGSQLKETVLVSEDRLSVNLKRHSETLPAQSSTQFF